MNTTVDNFDNIGRNTPYRVPQGYFDKQKERLLSIADTGNKRRGDYTPQGISHSICGCNIPGNVTIYMARHQFAGSEC